MYYKWNVFFVKMVIRLCIRSTLKKRPQSYGEYLKNETTRNKKKRIEVIQKWYDFIHSDKKNFNKVHKGNERRLPNVYQSSYLS